MQLFKEILDKWEHPLAWGSERNMNWGPKTEVLPKERDFTGTNEEMGQHARTECGEHPVLLERDDKSTSSSEGIKGMKVGLESSWRRKSGKRERPNGANIQLKEID